MKTERNRRDLRARAALQCALTPEYDWMFWMSMSRWWRAQWAASLDTRYLAYHYEDMARAKRARDYCRSIP